MRSREALIRSARAVSSTSLVRQSVLSGTYLCPRCFSSDTPKRIASTRPAQLAFKWFRKSRDFVELRKEEWNQSLNRLRIHGEFSRKQIEQFIKLLDDEPDPQWLSGEDTIRTIDIALRTSSIDAARLVRRLYQLAKRQTENSLTGRSMLDDLHGPDLVRALALSGNDQEALEFCSEARNTHKQPLLLWKSLYETYRDQGDLVGFLKARDSMMLQRLMPDVYILNLQLELLNVSKLFEDAQVLYSSMPTDYEVAPNWETRLIIMDTCMNKIYKDVEKRHHDNISLGQDVYRRLNQMDARDHADVVYPKLLSWIVFNGGKLDGIHNKIHEMKEAGVHLDIDIVNTMLYAASKAEDWLVVERLWRSLKSADVLPNNHTFSLRIAASVMAGDTVEAKAIFGESESAGFADLLDPMALQTLLASEMMSKQCDDTLCYQILDLLERTAETPITPTSLMFLVPKLIEKKQFQRLEAILERSEDRDDWDTTRVINMITDEVSRAQDTKTVWNLFVLLKNLFWNDEHYNLSYRNKLLQRLIKLDAGNMAGAMFKEFLTSKIKPDDKMYIQLLQGGIEMKDYDLIRRVHQSMKMDMNISEHTVVLNTLMNAYAHVHSTLAFDIWTQIAKSARGPTQASVSIILDCCSFSGAPERGQFIWRSLQRRDFAFNDNNFASYVEMMNRNNRPAEAIRAVTDGLKWNQAVGERTISTLYNTSSHKTDVAEWAKVACPGIWTRLHGKD